MSTTSTSLPKPALSYQNLIVFLWSQTQRLTLVGVEMWTENRPRESARPCSFPVLKVFFQGPRGLPCPQLPQACQNQHYRTKTL